MSIYYIHSIFIIIYQIYQCLFSIFFLSVLSPRTDPPPAAKASAAFSLEPESSGHLHAAPLGYIWNAQLQLVNM